MLRRFANRHVHPVFVAFLTVTALLLTPNIAAAHVKWFSDFSFADQPLTLQQVVSPLFLGMTALTFVAIGAAVLIDRGLEGATWYQRVNQWLDDRKDSAYVVMRIATGATLLMSWQADALLVPELDILGAWVGWLQFAIALLLLFKETTPAAGVGLIGLYAIGVTQYGIFYMLDYALFIGVAWFLIVHRLDNITIKGTGTPALYIAVGFSLLWVGLEKLIYPQWSLYILEQNPQLALGFPLEFFLVGAAFVELALGYLLVIGLLGRPLSLVITLVFFTTTLVFGKVEVIGHTIIHGALIAFLLQGPGEVYKTPVALHKRLPLRTAFASVNFVLALAIFMVPYSAMAQQVWRNNVDDVAMALAGEVCGAEAISLVTEDTPTVQLDIVDTEHGTQVNVLTENFVWSEEGAEQTTNNPAGHAHLYIDGQHIKSIYDGSIILPEMEKGQYEVSVALVNPYHQQYIVERQAITESALVSIR